MALVAMETKVMGVMDFQENMELILKIILILVGLRVMAITTMMMMKYILEEAGLQVILIILITIITYYIQVLVV